MSLSHPNSGIPLDKEAKESALTQVQSPGETPFSNDDKNWIFSRTISSQSPQTAETTHRYQKVCHHANGGMGIISIAQDQQFERIVAFKEMRPQDSRKEQKKRRFVFEAQLTGKLEHPSIVPVYSLGSHPDGTPYYAMRFIKGENLQEAIRRFQKSNKTASEKNLELRQLLKRFLDVCNAIGYAHSQGVIHRDLKPANVMLGEFGETLVVDWGLAKKLRNPSAPIPERKGVATGEESIGLVNRISNPLASLSSQEKGRGRGSLSPNFLTPFPFNEEETNGDPQTGLANKESKPACSPLLAGEGLGVRSRHLPTPFPTKEGHDSPYFLSLDSESHLFSMDETLIGIVVGTPNYMSPEQANGQGDQVSFTSDIFSLGAMLYHLLTGKPPYLGKTDDAILDLASKGNYVPPIAISRSVPRALNAIVCKSMSRESKDRYVSAQELAQDIENWLAGEKVVAYSEPWIARIQRWARKHQSLVGALVGLIFTAMIGLSIGMVLVNEQKNRAEFAEEQMRMAFEKLQEEETKTKAALIQAQQEEAQKHAAWLRERAAKQSTRLAEEMAVKSLRKVIYEVGRALENKSGIRAHPPMTLTEIREKLLRDSLRDLRAINRESEIIGFVHESELWGYLKLLKLLSDSGQVEEVQANIEEMVRIFDYMIGLKELPSGPLLTYLPALPSWWKAFHIPNEMFPTGAHQVLTVKLFLRMNKIREAQDFLLSFFPNDHRVEILQGISLILPHQNDPLLRNQLTDRAQKSLRKILSNPEFKIHLHQLLYGKEYDSLRKESWMGLYLDQVRIRYGNPETLPKPKEVE